MNVMERGILIYNTENTICERKYKTKVCNPEKWFTDLKLLQQISPNLCVGMFSGVQFVNFLFPFE